MIISRWPLHPLPIEGESLTSWLSRIAICYGLTLEELLSQDLDFVEDPSSLDYIAPTNLIDRLAERTGLPATQIYAMKFESLVPFLFDGLGTDENDFESYTHQFSVLLSKDQRQHKPAESWTPWFSSSHSKHIYACRDCLAGDPAPATRLVWMLPFMLSCSIHKRMLEPCTILTCVRWVYWQKDDTTNIPYSPAIHTMDQRTWQAFTQGYVSLPGRRVHAGVWFRVLRTMLDELNIPLQEVTGFKRQLVEIWKATGYYTRAGNKAWKPFESLTIRKQRIMLFAAAIAIQMIEDGNIRPKGKEVALFRKKEPVSIDLPSRYVVSENNTTLPSDAYRMAWQQLVLACDQILSAARTNEETAKQLRGLLLT